MRISLRLSIYLGRSFLFSYLTAITILTGLKFFKDVVAYGRNATSPGISAPLTCMMRRAIWLLGTNGLRGSALV